LGFQPKLPKGRLKLLFQMASPFSGCPSQGSLKPFPAPNPSAVILACAGMTVFVAFQTAFFFFLIHQIQSNQTI